MRAKLFSSPHALTLALIAVTMLVLEAAQPQQISRPASNDSGPEQPLIMKAGFLNQQMLHL